MTLQGRVQILEDLIWAVHEHMMRGEFDPKLAKRLNALVSHGRWTEPGDERQETSDETGDASGASAETELFAMLRGNPPLMASLYAAMKCGRYLVTVHHKAKDSPPDDLLSSHVMVDFPTDEVITVLQGHCRHILGEETARLQRQDGHAADKRRWT